LKGKKGNLSPSAFSERNVPEGVFYLIKSHILGGSFPEP
jgi:hypothetical protein